MSTVDQLCQEIYSTPPQTERRNELLRRLAHLNGLQAEESYRAAMALGAEVQPEFVERACDLALEAWQHGVANAGALYAHCVDRLCLLRQELPKFGVNRWQHDGQMMMPILDGTVNDAERTALGLPPLSEARIDLEVENRHRAEEQYRAPLPADVHMRRVWRKWSEAELRSHAPVWVDGDDITFIYEGEANEVWIIGGLHMPLWRIPETDLWAVSVRVQNLKHAVITFGFQAYGGSAPRISSPLMHQWRGPGASPPPLRAKHLAGQVLTDEVESPALGRARGLSVYLPPDHDPDRPIPVIYATDGQIITSMAAAIDPLISAGKLPQVLLIGVHNAGIDFYEQRTREYIPEQDPDRFEAHRRFFMEEVPFWAEMVVGASNRREQRAIFGCSSGGLFATTMGARYPEFYGNVIAFSLSGRFSAQPAWQPGQAPRHYLVAGTLEFSFAQRTRAWAAWAQGQGAEVRLRERVFGHDSALWEEEFPEAAAWVFGTEDNH